MFSSIDIDDEEAGLFKMPKISNWTGMEKASSLKIAKTGNDPVFKAMEYLKNSGPKTLFFDFACSRTEVGEDFYNFLEQLKIYLGENPGKQVTLYGHADSRGSEEANFYCSQERAEFIKTQLIESGIDEMQIQVEVMGDDFPIASNDTPEGRQMNRRVEISVPV